MPRSFYTAFKMYCIVAFPDEKDCVAVVPRSWILDNGKCLWPPFSKTRLENAVKKSEIPTTLTAWRQNKARVIKVFGEYFQAKIIFKLVLLRSILAYRNV